VFFGGWGEGVEWEEGKRGGRSLLSIPSPRDSRGVKERRRRRLCLDGKGRKEKKGKSFRVPHWPKKEHHVILERHCIKGKKEEPSATSPSAKGEKGKEEGPIRRRLILGGGPRHHDQCKEKRRYPSPAVATVWKREKRKGKEKEKGKRSRASHPLGGKKSRSQSASRRSR